MNFNRQNIFQATSAKKTVVWDAGLRSYMLKIYNYMSTIHGQYFVQGVQFIAMACWFSCCHFKFQGH